MANRLFDRLLPKPARKPSLLRKVISGSFFKISDLRGNTSLSDINTQINTMRALARDSQISTALSYYATDATTVNTDGQIIWATSPDVKELGGIINKLFKRWDINSYARDHILELATIGNLYIPTTDMYKDDPGNFRQNNIALDNNTIPNTEFDIVPSYKIPPEDVVHLWFQGQPEGYMYQPEDKSKISKYISYPESAIIHFSLGGLLGDYTLDTLMADGSTKTYDIKFAQPLMEKAVQPTQTLSLLEDATLLSSLVRVIRFINVECGNAEEEEIDAALQDLKNVIEQQLSINTDTGDTQSYVNPQSPNNLIFLPRINGQDVISITDLNMADTNDQDSALLAYYQDKKLSVLGVPKEAMNFSSNEGLGGAGSVLSQRSAIYANSLQRLTTAYIAGWTKAINTYFISRGLSGYVDKFKLHMAPIITTMSTIQFEKRDAAINQANSIISLMKGIGIDVKDQYRAALVEILSEVFPQIGASASNWSLNLDEGNAGGGMDGF